MAEQKKTFLKGAAVLGIAGLIIKFLGAVFRIPLANIIGDTGMGYYQTPYPVYVLLLTLSTAGIPVAISRMVAEREAINRPDEAFRVFTLSFRLLLYIGLASFSILFFGASAIVGFLKNPEAVHAMRAIAPALLIVPMMAAFRGYFQGQQNMKPTAISQVSEQVARVFTGLALAVFLLKYGLEYAAAGASFGATAGAIVGMFAVLIIYFRNKDEMRKHSRSVSGEKEPSSKIMSQILIIAVPITIGAAIMPIMNALDVAIVMRRLTEAGFSSKQAIGMFGQLTGMAGPLINFPQVLTQAIAMSLVPAVAESYKLNELERMRHNIELGLRSALIVGLPCALGMMALSKPIMLLLYPAKAESAASASSSLFILAAGIIFLSTVQTLTGVLQGIGKQIIPVINLAIGAVVKVVITYTLTGIEDINIKGAAFGTVAAYIVASTLNLLAVKKYTKTKFDAKMTFIKPVFAAVVMAACARFSYFLFTDIVFASGDLKVNAISCLTAVMVGAIVYVFMLLAIKGITEEEIKLLPKGKKIVGLFERYKK